MTKEFEGKTALVTGAGSGIGAEIARRLGAAGANVVVADIDESAAGEIAAEIEKAGGTAASVQQDVSDADSVKRSVEFAVERFGGLHLAVNNAGIGGDQAPTADYGLEDWDKVIAVNATGAGERSVAVSVEPRGPRPGRPARLRAACAHRRSRRPEGKKMIETKFLPQRRKGAKKTQSVSEALGSSLRLCVFAGGNLLK